MAAWMLTASALVLIMTPGLSFFYGGMVRSRNVASTMLQSFVAMGVISVRWDDPPDQRRRSSIASARSSS